MRRISGKRFRSLSTKGFQVPVSADSAFEGADGGARFSHWSPTDVGPNTALDFSLGSLRSRSRQQERDNALATSIVEQYVTNLIGTGIRPKWSLKDEALQERVQELWEASEKEMDADNQVSFYGLQEIAARSMFVAGEVLGRRRPRRLADGLLVPMQIQLIEPDHLDGLPDQKIGGGREIRQGIELDAIGNRRAYHLLKRHPGELDASFGDPSARSVVPAREILHMFRVLRPGQLRGVPHMHSTLLRLYNLDQYADAELERKKQAAMKVGWIKTAAGDIDLRELFDVSDFEDALDERDAFYQAVGKIRSGSWNVLMPGDDIEYNDPQDVGSNFKDFMRENKREAAAAANVTYEQATGDMEGVNYSSARVRLIDIRRGFEMVQQNAIAHQLCRPIIRWWLEAAVAVGWISQREWEQNKLQLMTPQWVADAFEAVDPLKDTMADVAEVRAGFSSRRQKQAERGNDPDKTDREIIRGNKAADKEGLVFDTDPRHTSKSGVAQKAEDAEITNTITEGQPNREAQET